MSSALDDDTQRALAEGRRTAGDMLRSAQKDLQKVFVVFVVGFIGTFYALQYGVWEALKRVTRAQMNAVTRQQFEIIAQTPFDVILLQAKIGLVVGIVVALPVFLYYSRDALKARGAWPSSPVAPWKLALIGLLAAALFLAGVAYGYFVFFPVMFGFLAGNAVSVGFEPRYSIVLWAQFIFLLTMSFGFAAQMPLAITGLSYAEIVSYETFRDKWRHATVLIFVFGAFFSPPDPFTQIMWAVPLLFLYGLSLYLAKIVVTARRGNERIEIGRVARSRWNVLAGAFALGAAAVYLFFRRGGVGAANAALTAAAGVPVLGSFSRYSVPTAGELLPLSAAATLALIAVAVGLLLAVAALFYFVYEALEAAAESVTPGRGAGGDPADIDLADLDVGGVRAAPPEAFRSLSEEEALARANDALDAGDHEKAQAILDRFDEAEAAAAAEADADADAETETGAGVGPGSADGADGAGGVAADVPGAADDLGDRASRASDTLLSELTEGGRDEDDIGGYYQDVAFILDSVTSRAFRLVGLFMIVLAGTFAWLYTGGIGDVFDDFLSRLPSQVAPSKLSVIALHPVEALIFEVKFSTLVAALVTLPLVAYYAWPAMREREIVRGHRRVIYGWVVALTGGLVGGFAIGYSFVASSVISYLVADAVRANMVISYRITDFFWLIFFTTAGIGLLADVPVAMVLLNTAGVSYRTMRERWREVTVAILAFAAFFTPAGIVSMFLVTIPLMLAYGVGLGLLFVVTLGGRRDLARPRGVDV